MAGRAWRPALLGAAMVSPFALSPAFAQGAAEPEFRNEIIVTAQRRSEQLEEVPMTIAAVSQATMETAGVTSMRDLSKVITGFQLGQGGGFPQPAVRGITTIINGTTFENNVAVYIDGFYEVAPQAISIDLPNVSDVQVLKGPQGTLYGRNATGGAILLNTLAPSDTWTGKVEATYARFDDKRLGGFLSGPISDQVGISLAGYIRRSDGYHKLTSRTVPGKLDGNAAPLEQDSVRLKLKAQMSDKVTATLGYNYTHTLDGRGNLFSVFENVSTLYRLPGAATRPTKLGTAAWDIETGTETWSHQVNLTLEIETGIGTLKSYSAYSSFKPRGSFDFDGSYINSRWSISEWRQKTIQQALDYSIDAVDNLDLVIGANYFNDKLRTIAPFHIANYLNAAAVVLDPGLTPPELSSLVKTEDRRFRQGKDAWAIYADATFRATDALSINIGGRYSSESQDVFGSSVDPRNGNVLFPATSRKATYRKFTPRGSIRYEIGPRTNVYASYSKGFRSGAWNASLPLLPAGPNAWNDAKQETVDAFEVGFKTAGSNYRFEVSGFYYDYKDLQVSYTTLVGNTTATIIDNAPSAEIYGIEGSFEWEPVENLTLRGGAAWLHARYGDGFIFFNATGVGIVPSATNPSGLAINTNKDPLKTYLNVSQNQDLSGLQMARAPDFTANFGIAYHIPNGDGGLRISTNVNYTDSYVVTNPAVWGSRPEVPAERQRKQRFRQSGYALVSAQATWTEPGGRFYVQVFGNNLTDKKYRLHYTGTAFGTYSPMAEPLTYGARIGYRF